MGGTAQRLSAAVAINMYCAWWNSRSVPFHGIIAVSMPVTSSHSLPILPRSPRHRDVKGIGWELQVHQDVVQVDVVPRK